MAIWDCGDGGASYVIRVKAGFTAGDGFRAIFGAIRVTDGALYIVSYDALTMAAQFDDEVLPAKHEKALRVDLPNGVYRIRVVQLNDPVRLSKADEAEPDFTIEYEQGSAMPWSGIAWASDAG